MPYEQLSDLPEAVQKLPALGQEIWQAAFNSAIDEYDGDESKAAATAWAAAKEKYEQDEDGAWYAIKSIHAALRGVWQALKGFFTEDPGPMPDYPTDGRLLVVQDKAAKRRRWVGVVSNSLYPDRDGEGFSLTALQKAVDYMMESGRPQTSPTGTAFRFPDRRVVLDLAHVEMSIAKGVPDFPLAVGQADCVGMAGPFVVATGLADNTPVATKFFDYVDAHPEVDLRMSHLFEYAAGARDNQGVFHNGVEIVRFTALPAGLAANPWTAFLADAKSTVGGMDMSTVQLDDRVRPLLSGVFGEDWVGAFESGLEKMAEMAVEDGAETKAVGAKKASEDDGATTEATTESPVEEKAPPAETHEPSAIDVAVNELQTRLDELAGMLAAETKAREALAKMLESSTTTTPPVETPGQAGRKVNDAGVPLVSPLAR